MSKTNKLLIHTLLFSILIFIVFKLTNSENFIYSIWSDRDLFRGSHFFNDIPNVGSELADRAGARIPGGGFYGLLWLTTAIHASPQVQMIILQIIHFLGIGIIIFGLRPWMGLGGRAVAALAYVATEPMIQVQFQLWNPAYITAFIAFSIVFSIRYAMSKKILDLAIIIGVLCFAGQIHMSAYLVLISLIFTYFINRISVPVPHILVSVVIIIFFLTPYLIQEISLDWENSKRMFHSSHTARGFLNRANDSLSSIFFLTNLKIMPDTIIALINDANSFKDILRLFVIFIGSLSAIAISIGYILFFIQWIKSNNNATEYTYNPFMVAFSLFICTAFMLALTSRQPILSVPRYLIVLLPIAAICIGFSFDKISSWSEGKGKIWSRIISVLLISNIAISIYFCHVILRHDFSLINGSFDAKRNLIIELEKLGYSRENIISNVSLFEHNNGDTWEYIKPREDFAFSYIVNNIPNTNIGYLNKCISIFIKNNAVRKPKNPMFWISLSTLSLENIIFINALEKIKYTIVEYHSKVGNCIRSFDNRYVPTQEELNSNIKWPINYPSPGNTSIIEFEIALPNELDRFQAYLRIDKRTVGYQAVIVGPDMRGPSQIPNGWFADYRLVNPVVIFKKEKSQEKYLVPILVGGALGDSDKGLFTPWKSRIFNLPNGEYTIYLKADKLFTKNINNNYINNIYTPGEPKKIHLGN